MAQCRATSDGPRWLSSRKTSCAIRGGKTAITCPVSTSYAPSSPPSRTRNINRRAGINFALSSRSGLNFVSANHGVIAETKQKITSLFGLCPNYDSAAVSAKKAKRKREMTQCTNHQTVL